MRTTSRRNQRTRERLTECLLERASSYSQVELQAQVSLVDYRDGRSTHVCSSLEDGYSTVRPTESIPHHDAVNTDGSTTARRQGRPTQQG